MSPPRRDGSLPPKQEATAPIHFSPLPTRSHHTGADINEYTPAGYGEAELREYIQAVYAGGGAQGRVHVAVGVKPYRTASGKIRFQCWFEGSATWPDAADELIALLNEYSPVFDVYVCPYVLSGPRRTKHTSVAPDVVHCDGDDGVDLEKARTIPGVFVVGSGTEGHGHVYVRLTRPVLHHQHQALCKGLAVYLGAKDPKFSDNDVLRPPGTWNFKPRADDPDAAPLPVTWRMRSTGVLVDPEELAALLGVELTDAPPPRKRKGRSQSKSREGGSAMLFETEPSDLARHPQVRRALAMVTVDRSKDTMRVVGACVRSGLTEAQVRWVVRQRADLRGRLDDRHDNDVSRCYEIARDSLDKL